MSDQILQMTFAFARPKNLDGTAVNEDFQYFARVSVTKYIGSVYVGSPVK